MDKDKFVSRSTKNIFMKCKPFKDKLRVYCDMAGKC